MTLKTLIRDGQGTGNIAGVSDNGELLVKGFGNIQSELATLNSTTTGFNFFTPLSQQNFVITTVIFDLGAVASTITIYEASSLTTLNSDRDIFTASLSKNQFTVITLPFGGFIPITEGEFLNAKVSAQPVNVTIAGFYRHV